MTVQGGTERLKRMAASCGRNFRRQGNRPVCELLPLLSLIEYGYDVVFFGFDFLAVRANRPFEPGGRAFEFRGDALNQRHAAAASDDIGPSGRILVEAIHDHDSSVGQP